MFFVYVDWTCEDVPRPFYVGKGNEGRVRSFQRNRHHTFVSKKLGIRREIVLESDDEKTAFDHERKLIQELGTYNPDHHLTLENIGCNKTLGGEGSVGVVPSEETRRRLSESLSGRILSDEHRAKISESRRGWVGLCGESNPNFGGNFSETHRKRLSEKASQRTGELNSNARLTAQDVIEIRQLSQDGHRVCDLVRQFNVSRTQINRIIAGQAWQHLIS